MVTIDETDYSRQIAYLLILRGAMLGVFLLLALYMSATAQMQIASSILVLLFTVATLVSIPPVWRLIMQQQISRGHLLYHVLLDITLLTALLYYMGGYTNPLISLYLLPVLVTAVSLSRHDAWLVGTVATAAYSLLLQWYHPLFSITHPADNHDGFHFHLLGMWFTFVMSVFLLAGVVTRMSEQRRAHDQQLADLMQRSIRQRGVIALGAQAASDAHEMGTPINTLMLLVDNLHEQVIGSDKGVHSEENETLQLMQQQLVRCQHILDRLANRASTLCHNCFKRESIAFFINATIAQWQNLNPQQAIVTVVTNHHNEQVLTDPMLEQSLFVLLDNAVDAGATSIEVTIKLTSSEVIIAVLDNGKGFDHDLMDQLGNIPLTTKEYGKGLGLYLVKFILEQMQGSIQIANRSDNGASVSLHLPINDSNTIQGEER